MPPSPAYAIDFPRPRTNLGEIRSITRKAISHLPSPCSIIQTHFFLFVGEELASDFHFPPRLYTGVIHHAQTIPNARVNFSNIGGK